MPPPGGTPVDEPAGSGDERCSLTDERPVGNRVDFSGNAPIYDRRHGAVLPPEIARELICLGGLQPSDRILDVGSGTGRVALAVAALGCRTVALDPAVPMLHELQRKAADTQIDVVAAEGARLPFAAGQFDAAILARILYLMSDWQTVLQHTSEVLKPCGRLFHEWGNGDPGEAWVQIREKARALFQDAGVTDPFHPGARSEDEVDAFLARTGFERGKVLPTGPGPRMTLRDFLGRIVSGELSYTWSLPLPVRESCLPALVKWCEGAFDLDLPVSIPQELRWTIYRKK